MQESPGTRVPLYIVVSLYLLLLLGVAIHSYLKGKRSVESREDKDLAKINEHFLASRSFGTIVLFLTTFSTIISGYTAYGIPNEASALGFYALRWLSGFICIILGYAIYAPRYRRVSYIRNWQSPNDILADKYNCNSLRIIGAIGITAPQVLYIAVQFISLRGMISLLSQGEIDGGDAVWFLVFFIWMCEVIGGFRSVSLTDAIQSGVMLFAFAGLPFVLLVHYRGFVGVNDNELPCYSAFEYIDALTNQTLMLGCIQYTKPYFNYYPPRGRSDIALGGWPDLFPPDTLENCIALLSQSSSNNVEEETCKSLITAAESLDANVYFNYVPLQMLSFSIAIFSSLFTPHWAQRIIAARSDKVVKKSLILTTCGFIVAVVPGVLLGITKAAMFPPSNTEQAFPAMLEELYNLGGGARAFSIVVMVAGIAAFMSTADSAAIGISNVITIEIFRNWLTPNLTSEKQIVLGKAISLISLVIARLLLYQPQLDVLIALNWQIGLGWAILPGYTMALFFPDEYHCGYAVLAGIVVHYIFLFIMEFGLIMNGINIYIYSGIYAGILNSLVVLIVNKLLPKQLRNDAERIGKDSVNVRARENFGGGQVAHLTFDTIRKCMKDVVEPATDRVGQVLLVLTFALLVLSMPWYGSSGWIAESELTGGMPTWGFTLTILSAVEFFLLQLIFFRWHTNELRIDDDAETTEETRKGPEDEKSEELQKANSIILT